MEAENRQQKIWLVKSSTRILGPYSLDEVEQLLAKKHISVIDEIRATSGRWKYIRENQVFGDIVEKLRSEDHAGEQTQTMTATVGTQTQTSATITRWDGTNPNVGDDLTPTPTPTPILQSTQKPPATPESTPLAKSEADFDKIKDITPTRVTNTERGGGYGASNDYRVQQGLQNKKRKLSRGLWAVVFVAGVAFLSTFLLSGQKKSSSFDTYVSQALRYKELQLYELSLASYKKAQLLREPTEEIQREMALPLIVLDRQLVHGRRLLELELQKEGGARERTINAGLGIAMSYILEGSLKEAEQTLQKIVLLEPQNFMIRLNLALIELRKGDSAVAERHLEDLMKRQSGQPLVILARLLAAIDAGVTKDSLVRNHLLNGAKLYLSEREHMKHELLLAMGLTAGINDLPGDYVVNTFLSALPFQEGNFVRDIRLDWKLADWDVLEKYCREYTSRLAPNARVKAMWSVCLSLAGRDAESRKVFDEAMAQAPKDPYVLFTQANLLYKNGLRNESYAVLRQPEVSVIPAAGVLMGKVCYDQGDLSCAEKSFRGVLSRGFDVTAQAGLAAILARQGQSGAALDLIREGLRKEPTYIPLIVLRETYEVRK